MRIFNGSTAFGFALLAITGNAFGYTLVLTPFPQARTIGVMPYEASHSYYPDGMSSYVKALDDDLSQVGQYTYGQLVIVPETGDVNRVEDVTVTFNIVHTAIDFAFMSYGCVGVIRSSPILRVLEHCDTSATIPVLLKTNTTYHVEVNAGASHLSEHLNELHMELPAERIVPTIACQGFDSPMDVGAVRVHKSRALPLKATLFDSESVAVTQLTPPPRLQVLYSSGVTPAVDVTHDALDAGASSSENQFSYVGGEWRFNLLTKDYSASGSYVISLVSGGEDDYLVDPPCSASFVIE